MLARKSCKCYCLGLHCNFRSVCTLFTLNHGPIRYKGPQPPHARPAHCGVELVHRLRLGLALLLPTQLVCRTSAPGDAAMMYCRNATDGGKNTRVAEKQHAWQSPERTRTDVSQHRSIPEARGCCMGEGWGLLGITRRCCRHMRELECTNHSL